MPSCSTSDGHRWEIYKDAAGQWRWRRRARNSLIVGASSEGYVNKGDCIHNARLHGMTCMPF